MTRNNDIRTEAKRNKVYLWQIAERMMITPSTLSVRMRHELDRQDKEEIMSVIQQLVAERE